MDILKELKYIKQIYDRGENVIKFLKNQKAETANSIEAIMVSYDFQAGTYIEDLKVRSDFINQYSDYLAKVIKKLGKSFSLLEAGVGEATTLGNVLGKLKNSFKKVYGFDISWSRVKKGQWYLNFLGIKDFNLFSGNLFEIPLQDNSMDIVYTSHSIEPNGGCEKEIMEELYRVTNKYLILLEPAYELANEEQRQRMRENGYITSLYASAKELGYKILEWRLFDVCVNPLNPTGILLIEKNGKATNACKDPFVCPITKTAIRKIKGAYFSESSFLVYPIIDNVPCLLSRLAVIATHYLDE